MEDWKCDVANELLKWGWAHLMRMSSLDMSMLIFKIGDKRNISLAVVNSDNLTPNVLPKCFWLWHWSEPDIIIQVPVQFHRNKSMKKHKITWKFYHMISMKFLSYGILQSLEPSLNLRLLIWPRFPCWPQLKLMISYQKSSCLDLIWYLTLDMPGIVRHRCPSLFVWKSVEKNKSWEVCRQGQGEMGEWWALRNKSILFVLSRVFIRAEEHTVSTACWNRTANRKSKYKHKHNSGMRLTAGEGRWCCEAQIV